MKAKADKLQILKFAHDLLENGECVVNINLAMDVAAVCRTLDVNVSGGEFDSTWGLLTLYIPKNSDCDE